MTFEKRAPDYKGNGIAVWVGEHEGEPVLTIKKDEWAKSLKAFKNKPKPKPEEQHKL